MKVLCFTSTYWHDAAMAELRRDDLRCWFDTCMGLFRPIGLFIACGTYSDPKLCPVNGPLVVNSGVAFTKPYNVWMWQYSLCGFSAAMWHALWRDDWDLLIFLDPDTVCSAIDFDAVVKEFLSRPEILCTFAWSGCPDLAWSAWKREAVVRFCHHRLRGNLVDDGHPLPLLAEHEWKAMYQGRWWNPWPTYDKMRQDYHAPAVRLSDEQVKNYPFVGGASPGIKKLFRETKQPKAKPLA